MTRIKPLLPDDICRAVVADIQAYLDDQLSLGDACRRARKHSRVTWLRDLLSDLEAYAHPEPDLPYAPRDSPWHPQCAESAAERAILFLQNKRAYDDGCGPVARLMGYAFVYTLVIGFLLFMATGFINEFIWQHPWLERAFETIAIIVACALALGFSFYAISLASAAVHIFRVRVLRQDLTPIAEQDIWPYQDKSHYDADCAKQREAHSGCA